MKSFRFLLNIEEDTNKKNTIRSKLSSLLKEHKVSMSCSQIGSLQFSMKFLMTKETVDKGIWGQAYIIVVKRIIQFPAVQLPTIDPMKRAFIELF